MKKSRLPIVITGILLFIAGTLQAQPDQHEEKKEQVKDHQEQHQEQPKQQQENKPEKQQQQKKPQPARTEQPKVKAAQEPMQQGKPAMQKPDNSRHGQQHQPADLKKQRPPVAGHVEQHHDNGLQKQQGNPAGKSKGAVHQRKSIQQNQQQAMWQQHRAASWQSEHRSWGQRGGYNGYRIPNDRFGGYFGQDHGFRIYSLSMEIYSGHPRFKYSGYWFGIMDPVPEYWPVDWYENDDVYIDYSEDGYYMYNRRYPMDRIALVVYLK